MTDHLTRKQSALSEPINPQLVNREIIAITRQWIEQVVIPLKLCPFAKQPMELGQVSWYVSYATTDEELAEATLQALSRFCQADPAVEETAFLIHPFVLTDFMEYNDFLDLVDVLIEEVDAEGVVQVASFHPDYRFAGTPEDAVELATNRSPFPMLHLLREDSITSAIATMASPEALYERNIEFLQSMGQEAVDALVQPLHQAAKQLVARCRLVMDADVVYEDDDDDDGDDGE